MMLDYEARREAEQRIKEHLWTAAAELDRAEVLAQALGAGCMPAAELAGLRGKISGMTGRFTFQGVGAKYETDPRLLRWALHDDMGAWERLFGRVGRFRHLRHRRLYRARLAREALEVRR